MKGHCAAAALCSLAALVASGASAADTAVMYDGDGVFGECAQGTVAYIRDCVWASDMFGYVQMQKPTLNVSGKATCKSLGYTLVAPEDGCFRGFAMYWKAKPPLNASATFASFLATLLPGHPANGVFLNQTRDRNPHCAARRSLKPPPAAAAPAPAAAGHSIVYDAAGVHPECASGDAAYISSCVFPSNYLMYYKSVRPNILSNTTCEALGYKLVSKADPVFKKQAVYWKGGALKAAEWMAKFTAKHPALFATLGAIRDRNPHCKAQLKSDDSSSTPPPRPYFTWDTLRVFFHSSNTSGPWSAAAVAQIARFALATNEKSHAMALPGGGRQSEEIAGPYACRQVNNHTRGAKNATLTMFYLNSVIDWPFNYKLHALMVKHPDWRLKNRTGHDIGPPGSGGHPGGSASPGGNWLYNLTNIAMRAAWVDTCVAAARAGCAGCFIDQANVNEGIATWSSNSAEVAAYRVAHLAALTELDAALAPLTGGFGIDNHLGTRAYGTSAMMVEDFAGTEKCVETLRTLAARNLTVEAHVGNYPAGNKCEHADTNSLAAFLIGAGEYHYYHCAPTWGSDARWPAVPDYWLDWLPEYDAPLGAPLGLATQRPSRAAGASLWSRSFQSGTRVEFDGGSANGTIWWANGVVQAGAPANLTAVAKGCAWESMAPLSPDAVSGNKYERQADPSKNDDEGVAAAFTAVRPPAPLNCSAFCKYRVVCTCGDPEAKPVVLPAKAKCLACVHKNAALLAKPPCTLGRALTLCGAPPPPPPGPRPPAPASPPHTIWVSAANGSDSNSGASGSSAMRTLPAALKKSKRNTTLLLWGTFRLGAGIHLNSLQNGLTIDRWPFSQHTAHSQPVISGGVVVPTAAWRESESEKGVWSADVSALPNISAALNGGGAIFVGGERRTVVRTPTLHWNASLAAAKTSPKNEHGFVFAAGDIPKEWSLAPASLARWRVAAFHSWNKAYHRVRSVTRTNDRICFVGPAQFPYGMYTYCSKERYYIENVPEMRLKPGSGDWRSSSTTLFYAPKPGEDMRSAEVVVPVVQTLLSVFADNVTFKSVVFEHTAGMPDCGGSAQPKQACDADLAEMCNGALSIGGANARLSDVVFRGVGCYGLKARKATALSVQRSLFQDCGAGGVMIDASPLAVVNNSWVVGFGQRYPAGVGIVMSTSPNASVTHCDISGGLYNGIVYGGVKDTGPFMRFELNHVHHNGRETDDGICDFGAIHGSNPGSLRPITIRSNVFHSIASFQNGGNGVYMDAGSVGLHVERNLVYNVTAASIVWNGVMSRVITPTPKNSGTTVVTNNVFVSDRDSPYYIAKAAEANGTQTERNPAIEWNGITGAVMQKNVFVIDASSARTRTSFFNGQPCAATSGKPNATATCTWNLADNFRHGKQTLKSNVYFNASGNASESDTFPGSCASTALGECRGNGHGGRSAYNHGCACANLAQWQAAGEDAGSSTADPALRGPLKLVTGKQALALGIEPLTELANVGPDWTPKMKSDDEATMPPLGTAADGAHVLAAAAVAVVAAVSASTTALRIEFFFDVISPYSALAWAVLERYKPLWNFELVLRPVFLGGIMKATGNEPPAMLPARALFQQQDLERNKALFALPMQPVPSNFFAPVTEGVPQVARSIVAVQRLIVAAQLHGGRDAKRVERLVAALFSAVHVDGANRSGDNELSIDPPLLERCAATAGYSSGEARALLAAGSTPAVKAGLKANTEEAVERGAYGSPTIFVTTSGAEELMVFGSDRFEQLAHAVGKSWLGPNPNGAAARL